LSTLNVAVASSAFGVKFMHRMLLSTFGLAATPSGGMKLPGAKGLRLVDQPGMTVSQSW
jgi:hypothetical protein